MLVEWLLWIVLQTHQDADSVSVLNAILQQRD